MKHIIDLKNIDGRDSLHMEIAKKLGFPDYYGKNLDALSDILSEGGGLTDLVFINRSSLTEEMKEYLQRLSEVLFDVGEARPGFCHRIYEKEERPIKTVILDIGNVLIRFSSLDFVKERFGEEMGLRIANAMYGGNRWVELDRGIMTDEEVLQSFFDADPGIPKEYISWCFDHVSHTVSPCGYAIPWIRDIRKTGRQVLYLSNYSKRIMYGKPEVLNFLPLMDGGIFSCDVKLIKPDLTIYELLIERFGLTPEECLFTDDSPENCRSAFSLGINVVQFRDPERDRPLIMELISD